MAIFHLSVKVISRGKGKSAVGAAAYRSGERIENAYDRVADYREDLFKAFYEAEVYSMKEVKQIVALLQDRDKAISHLQKQKEVLHKNLDEDSEKRQKLIASMSKDEFYSAIAKESVYKKIEDEKTRNDLKEFYGDEYQDIIFKT